MVRKIIDLKKGSAWKCVHLLRIQITHFKRNGGAISDKQIVFRCLLGDLSSELCGGATGVDIYCLMI